jgi:hypothetical protein
MLGSEDEFDVKGPDGEWLTESPSDEVMAALAQPITYCVDVGASLIDWGQIRGPGMIIKRDD